MAPKEKNIFRSLRTRKKGVSNGVYLDGVENSIDNSIESNNINNRIENFSENTIIDNNTGNDESQSLTMRDYIYHNPSTNLTLYETSRQELNRLRRRHKRLTHQLTEKSRKKILSDDGVDIVVRELEIKIKSLEDNLRKFNTGSGKSLAQNRLDFCSDVNNSHEATSSMNAVPMVRVDEHGEIVLDEASLTRTIEPPTDDSNVIEESEFMLTNYGSFTNRVHSQRWSEAETTKFINALKKYGTDFSWIERDRVLPGRNRRQLKNKFRKMRMTSPELISSILK